MTYTTELNGDCDIVGTLGLELEVLNSEVLVVLGVWPSDWFLGERSGGHTGDTVTFSVSGGC